MIFAPRISGYSMLLPTLLVAAAVIQAATALTCYSCQHYNMKAENDLLNAALAAYNSPDTQCTQGGDDFAKNPSPTLVCPSTSTICSKVDVTFDMTVRGATGVVSVEMIARGCADPTWGTQGDGCAWGNDYKRNLDGVMGSDLSITGDVSGWICGCTGGDLCNAAPAAVTSSLVLMMASVYAATKLA